MLRIISNIFLCLCIFATRNSYADYNEDIAAINKGMPKLVQQFNKRQIECNHWTGEEPYDKERANQINTAVTKLKCDDLEKDEIKLLKKYKLKPKVKESINKAKAFT
jgi:hypothetical protein